MTFADKTMTPDCWLDGPRGEGGTNHGEISTRRWVVETILDLAGYTADADLAMRVAVEPACGAGAFVVPMAERLLRSCKLHGRSITDAAGSILAVDLLAGNVDLTRKVVTDTLTDAHVPQNQANALSEQWIRQGDFLLDSDLNGVADFVVGNPPYVRLEDIPASRSSAYRRRCQTMGGRADLFVGFFEVGLHALAPGGSLGFICADRWMRNQYGRKLRLLISEHFSLAATVVMHDVDAFEERVSAYPAITIVRREEQADTLMADTTNAFGPSEAKKLVSWSKARNGRGSTTTVEESFHAAVVGRLQLGAESWPAGTPEELAIVTDLEARFPRLEASAPGTKVGIGVATGADGVFITTDPDLVERDRLLPLSMVRDTSSGEIDWSGHYLVNPWTSAGSLVTLDSYPRLKEYFQRHSSVLRQRYVARSRPHDWFRTIDGVNLSLSTKPKLLLADMRLNIWPVFEDHGLYPHHNLYYVVSDAWDLRVLGGLLLSAVAEVFIRAYAVKMRGGTLRFQAQYVRRICVPHPESISQADQEALTYACEKRDRSAATEIAIRLYGLDPNMSICEGVRGGP